MKISDFASVILPLNQVAYLHFVDVSESSDQDKNKKVQLLHLISGGFGFSLNVGSEVSVNSAEILALNTTPKKILDGQAVAPNYNMLFGCFVKYTHGGDDYTGNTDLVVVDSNGNEVTARYGNILSESATTYSFITFNYDAYKVGNNSNNAHDSSNLFITVADGDPSGGNGLLAITPVYRTILTF